MDAARFLASLSPDIPWHVTAFHKDYKMTEPDNTTARTLIRAAEIGEEAGLRYVYAGNLPGQVGEYEHTFCPNCKARLIEGYGYPVLGYRGSRPRECAGLPQKAPGASGPATPNACGRRPRAARRPYRASPAATAPIRL